MLSIYAVIAAIVAVYHVVVLQWAEDTSWELHEVILTAVFWPLLIVALITVFIRERVR